MDLSFTPAQETFRAQARAWLRDHAPREPLPSFDTKPGWDAHRAWERELADAGWAVVNWPAEHGGRDAGLIEWLIFEEEYWGSGAPGRVNQNGIFLLGPVLLEFGTAEQKARFLPKIARSEEMWCQGWSEPNSGSDLASLTSRAVRDGDEWVLNGQKTWCSRGAFADHMFGLFRSEPGSERHKGLSFILVPLDTPGVSVRPIAQLDGETGFAEVFLDDVRVPVEPYTIGAPGDGWKITMSTAGFERGVMLRSPGRFLATAKRLVEEYRSRAASLPSSLRDEVARAAFDAESYQLHTYWMVSQYLAGGEMGAETSLNKIFWSEMDLRMHRTALQVLGAEAEIAGPWSDGFFFALAGPIYAGTNEIQRNIVAERVLGLPR
jgi:alkylation response protein AidB-like acyl-CoA dehydrogenase